MIWDLLDGPKTKTADCWYNSFRFVDIGLLCTIDCIIYIVGSYHWASAARNRGDWKDEFVKALTYDRMGRLETWFTQFASASASTSDGRTSYHKIPQDMRKYLLMHCCQQRVLQTQEVSLDEWRIASKLSSEGPFLNHHSFHWDEGSLDMIRAMASTSNEESQIPGYGIQVGVQ
jgi:hypothetical protein